MNRAIAWFAENKVTANLLMVVILAAGLISLKQIKLEVFPEFSSDVIMISVPYLGAPPEEVEEGVCVRIEEAIQDLEGIKKISSTAAEGVGSVTVEVQPAAIPASGDIKNRCRKCLHFRRTKKWRAGLYFPTRSSHRRHAG